MKNSSFINEKSRITPSCFIRFRTVDMTLLWPTCVCILTYIWMYMNMKNYNIKNTNANQLQVLSQCRKDGQLKLDKIQRIHQPASQVSIQSWEFPSFFVYFGRVFRGAHKWELDPMPMLRTTALTLRIFRNYTKNVVNLPKFDIYKVQNLKGNYILYHNFACRPQQLEISGHFQGKPLLSGPLIWEQLKRQPKPNQTIHENKPLFIA